MHLFSNPDKMILNPYRFAAAGGAFSPLDVSGCVLWLDGSDASTMYDATTGGSLVADGGSVARWEDKSTAGNDATQSTSAARALRDDSSVNSLTTLSADGSDDYFTFSSSITATTFFVVYEVTGTVPDYGGFALTASGNGPWYYTAARIFQQTSATDAPMRPPSKSGTAVWKKDGTTFDPDATVFGTGAHVYAAVASSSVSFDQTRDRTFTSRVLPGGYFCEYIAYSGALSTADRESVETYLGDKWGITITH